MQFSMKNIHVLKGYNKVNTENLHKGFQQIKKDLLVNVAFLSNVVFTTQRNDVSAFALIITQ